MSLQDLYVDALWNLHAGARLMLIDLRLMADAVSDQELALALRDFLSQVDHRFQRLRVMVGRFSGPARMHAEELEALTGHAARYTAGWTSGDIRDIAVGTVCRAAAHYMIPQYQLACALARTLGYEAHVADLEPMLAALGATDETLRQLVEHRIDAHVAHA